jgi:hypothetical protein
MDNFLVEYLSSGKAFVLVGSGPSIAMGYPSWEQLSSDSINLIRAEYATADISSLDTAHKKKDFPQVFEKAASIVSLPRLLQFLKSKFISNDRGEIYRLITRWPVPVFLTTNYDNEIHKHLVSHGEAYETYGNTEENLANLTPDCDGAIFKIHGDLVSESSIILTTSQYEKVTKHPAYDYWRIKLTSLFQMQQIVVIGHSLTDTNIRHILELAKKGCGVTRPICWIAPHVDTQTRQEYLLKHRIRVIPYDNSDGKHSGLLRVIQTISDFIPPRTSVQIQQNIAAVSKSPLGVNAAAPGFFVFNRLSKFVDIDKMHDEALLGAIQSSLPALSSKNFFDIHDVPLLLGWPSETTKNEVLLNQIKAISLKENIFVEENGRFKVKPEALKATEESRNNFNHLKQRFHNSLIMRMKRDFPDIDDKVPETIATDIEASLSGYFREGGLTLASSLFSNSKAKLNSALPSSMLKFITEASAKYSNYLHRLIFIKSSVDSFVRATSAEKEFLGRVSNGFFSLHFLGLFGNEAINRLQHAKQTIWLLDSDSQIHILALASPSNLAFSNCFTRLKSLGIRFFSTKSIASETWRHLEFALKLIHKNGENSPMIIAGAMGDVPYGRSNRFLQGFIAWKAAGNPPNWNNYLYTSLGSTDPKEEDLLKALYQKGIESYDIDEWPGFKQIDFAERDELIHKIVEIGKRTFEICSNEDIMDLTDLEWKAKPEADTLLIVANERNGKYHMLSDPDKHSPSWFISQTSILNLITSDVNRITWQPESFLRFSENLYPSTTSKEATEKAFEILLWQLARCGVSTIDESTIELAFAGIIDQTQIIADEQMQIYESTISKKYGENQEEILSRLRPIQRPLASLQLAHEIAVAESGRRQKAELESKQQKKRADVAEKSLEDVMKYKKKLDSRKVKAQRIKNKQKSGRKKKKKKK